MTIKEMERITSMTRANIRYYESEGLISSQRQENGYRVYSEADAQTLQKIKLFRALDISLEDIKAIQAGSKTVSQALEGGLQNQEAAKIRLERIHEITRKLLEENADYASLDAQHYLQLLEGQVAPDTATPEPVPYRRYFARSLDYSLCYTLVYGLLLEYLVSGWKLMLVALGLMIPLEAACLHFFGTTPGKWIFGLRVSDLEDRNLSFGAAVERTWTVLWEGEGLRLPVICLYFNYKSYVRCDAGESLPWEWDSEVTCKDDKLWRWLVYALAALGLWALRFYIFMEVAI